MLDYPSRSRGTLVGIGLMILGLVVASLGVFPAAIFDPGILANPYEAGRIAVVVYMILNFVGFAVVGLGYLRYTGRGLDFLDFGRPGRRDLLWIVGGFVLVILIQLAIGIVATLLDLPAADSEIVLLLGEDMTMILIMMAIVVLFNAPAEELLFRNVIQKRLYDSFSGPVAVVVASGIFVLPHVLTFVTQAENSMAVVVSLAVILGGSLVMGYAYLRTENLFVPIGIHAGMNLFQLLIYLLTVVYEIDEGAMAGILLGL